MLRAVSKNMNGQSLQRVRSRAPIFDSSLLEDVVWNREPGDIWVAPGRRLARSDFALHLGHFLMPGN